MQQQRKRETIRYELPRPAGDADPKRSEPQVVEQHPADDEVFEGVSVRGVLWRWQVRRRRGN